jgi:N-acetylmuramoyl-L-alanine amidase
VKAIRRAVLADVVRVIIELDAEVAFHDERLDNPARVFVDLSSTRANPALIDQTLRFDADTDIVRQIRIGRHPNNVTRIVLEAAGVSSYSVYPLYSPFRLVIDCLRTNPPATVASLPRGELPRSATGVPSIAAATSIAPEPRVAAPPDALPFSWRPLTRIARVDATPVASLDTASPVDTRTSPTAAPAPAATLSTPDRDLPAWATVARTKTLPVLRARRVRWVLPLPAAVVRALPENAPPTVSAGDAATVAATATATPPTAPSKPSAPAATLPPGPPVHNVAGGLSIARQLGLGVSRIVIDPGHGGHDPGAKGPGVTEAELVLDVALRLEKLLSKLPGVEVTLTRRENEFIPLQERTAIANREGADLFLSIHANASNVPAARGVETYFLNFASNQNAAAVAARENATSDQTMGSLQDVVKAIALNSKLDESRDFATYVQREMLDSLRPANKTVKDLGVKQAPFVVLIGASMPSVLAEISFVTNPQEAKLLKSGSYRQRIAQALFEGIKKYQVSLKSAATIAQQQN